MDIYKTDIKKLAEKNFKGFVHTLYRLLVIENRNFDLLVGAGTTGILMTSLTELVYKKLNRSIPPILTIPVLRYKGEEKIENLFDNGVLYPYVYEELSKTNKVNTLNNILFVDDEIYAGHLVKKSMKLILRYKNEKNIFGNLICTIVAEDQGIDPNFTILDIDVDLQLFAQGIDGTSNVITYVLPEKLEKAVKEVFKDSIKDHWIINILLGLPVRKKVLIGDRPEFTYEYIQLAEERIPNFKELQTQAFQYVDILINDSLQKFLY